MSACKALCSTLELVSNEDVQAIKQISVIIHITVIIYLLLYKLL